MNVSQCTVYNTTFSFPVFTSVTVGKRVPSPHPPWISSSFRTRRLAQTSDPIRLPRSPEDRSHTRLGLPPHSLTLRAGSMLLGTPRSALRGRSPSGLRQDPPPQQTPSSNAQG